MNYNHNLLVRRAECGESRTLGSGGAVNTATPQIYISAHDPHIHVLASAEWFGKAHPMAWVKPYGSGRVFYTTLGHGPGTFERSGMQKFLTQGVKWAAAS